MRWVFLINLARLAVKAYELGIPFIVFTFWRSPEDQVKEYDAGRSRTINGLHPRWLAIDLALWDDMNKDGTVDKNEIRWSFDPRYTTLGQYWESLGGVWGGRWKDPCDPYHFEWSDQMKL
jgi:hypothetical protein